MENQKEGKTCHKEALKGDFGATLNNINGGLECPAYKGGWHADAIKLRLNRYCQSAHHMGMATLSSLEGCKGMADSYTDCLGDGTCPYCEQYYKGVNPEKFASALAEEGSKFVSDDTTGSNGGSDTVGKGPAPVVTVGKPPTVKPTTRSVPAKPKPASPPQTRSPSANVGVEDALFYAKRDIDTKIFVYESGWSDWLPSTQYRFDGFLKGLQVMYLEGVGDLKFYLGEDVSGDEGVVMGLVNIAAFLAQSMKETIKYNACDEVSQGKCVFYLDV